MLFDRKCLYQIVIAEQSQVHIENFEVDKVSIRICVFASNNNMSLGTENDAYDSHCSVQSVHLHSLVRARPRDYEKKIIKFFLLVNVKMPTTVGILTFMSRKNDILGLSEPEKC